MLIKLNESSSTSYKRLDDNNLDNDNSDINYAIKSKNQQNVSKAYILSLEIFKSTLHQSLVRANDINDNNNYLLNNNKDCHKMSFS